MIKCEKCLNCGSSLSINKAVNNEITCPYCRTTYHVDNLGMIEEYKVKLKYQNKLVYFYIGSVTVEPCYSDTYRTIDGQLHASIINDPNIILELISYKIEEEK